ncbi:4'-phosphopantetheinyl transferase superfamily protein [Paraburkholderia sp. B3]|uniref:4'-phosphopantetheinyl transferase family protein n=1 Tax=Paraburkholderia sp. B3 TaxID=3134791 RepID=UPI003981C2E2
MRSTPHAGAARRFQPSSHPIYETPGIEFIPHRSGLHTRTGNPLPCSGELMIWRLSASWDYLSCEEASLWLSRQETAHMRQYRNPSFSRRYAIARASLRHLLADVLGKAPQAIELTDNDHGQPMLREPDLAQPLALRVAFAGIWITIGMSADAFGLETIMPGAACESAAPLARGRVQADLDCARTACASQLLAQPVDLGDRLRTQRIGAVSVHQIERALFKVIDLPMPGRISAAAATPLSTSTIHAYGWLSRRF